MENGQGLGPKRQGARKPQGPTSRAAVTRMRSCYRARSLGAGGCTHPTRRKPNPLGEAEAGQRAPQAP